MLWVTAVIRRQSHEIEPDRSFRDFEANQVVCVKDSGPDDGKFYQCPPANPDALSGRYTRRITIQKLDDERARVKVYIEWDRHAGSGRNSLIVEEVIYGPPA